MLGEYGKWGCGLHPCWASVGFERSSPFFGEFFSNPHLCQRPRNLLLTVPQDEALTTVAGMTAFRKGGIWKGYISLSFVICLCT